MDGLPDDVVADIMDFVQTHNLLMVCKKFQRIWYTSHLWVSEDSYGNAVARHPAGDIKLWPPRLLNQNQEGVRWLRYTGERFAWQPGPLRPNVLTLHINSWIEQGNLCKMIQWCRPFVRRLVLQSTATVHNMTLAPVCELAATADQLCSLDVRVIQGHINDMSISHIASLIGKLKVIQQLSIVVPMNSITIAGLQRLIDGLLKAPTTLRDIHLDISGNWIRGPDYGKQLARLALLPSLRSLTLVFGGWGVRKQFGLEYFILLGSNKTIQTLSLTIVGARITCEFFKKAMHGIIVLPLLRRLHIDIATCEVGDQCIRGLSLLRLCVAVEHLSLALGSPTERLLIIMGAIRHLPSLREFRVRLDYRGSFLTMQHAHQIAQFDNPNCVLDIHIQNANVLHCDGIQGVLRDGFHQTKRTDIRFHDCHGIPEERVCLQIVH